MDNQTDNDFIEGMKYLCDRDYFAAVASLKQSALHGNGEACYRIGELYQTKGIIPKAYYWYIEGIKRHNSNAMAALAIFYRYGIHVKKSYRYCLMYNERAASFGNSMAMLELHELFNFGYGVKKNRKKSLYWLKQAAILENELAMNDLAAHYLEGSRGVKKNFKLALYWYQQAANLCILEDTIADLYFFGNKLGLARFGWEYDNINDVYFLDHEVKALIILDIFDAEYQDIKKAIHWYEKCAEHRVGSAMKKLAYLLKEGILIEKDVAKSEYWYKRERETNFIKIKTETDEKPRAELSF